MAKLYYRIDVRLMEDESIEYGFWYSDGYAIIENEKLKGFLTLDKILGKIQENIIVLTIFEEESKHNYIGQYDSFINLPGNYVIPCISEGREGTQAAIRFLYPIKKIEIQKEIEEILIFLNQT